MLEFNYWFFVLLANFIVLIFLLNLILFRPLQRIFNKRQDGIDGNLRRAKEMNEKREEILRNLNRELTEANLRARNLFNEILEEGKAKQMEFIASAEKESRALLEKAKREIEVETEKAKISLRKEIEDISEEIVKKMVGV